VFIRVKVFEFFVPAPVTKPESAGVPTSAPANTGWWRHPITLAGLLLLLTLAAYLPALRCGFIWDDDEYVTDNPMLTDTNGLHEIWFSAHTQSQYFPLVYTTFRLERQLWGLNPLGYHLVNILLHGLNAALVWVILKRLPVPGAWLAAALFALHPVQVESVAWISELKNLESLLFYLLALLAWMKCTDAPGQSSWPYYGLALAAYLLALFAKTTACTLPASLLLVLWLRGHRLGWLRAIQILPFVLAGLGLGLVTIWWEKHLGSYHDTFDLSFTFLQRGLIASRALWFYAGKLVWPAGLTICYPQWQINAANPAQYLPGLGCLAVAALLWAGRKKIGRGVIAGVVFFVAALSPLLGLVIEGAFHYTYVADHYQYGADLGLLAVFAAILWRGFAKTGFWIPVQVALLLALGVLTWRQCGPYHDRETLWRDNVAKNPSSWMGHLNLGQELFKQGHLDEALEQYRAAVALHPNGDQEQANLGTALLEKGLFAEGIQHLEAALAINPRLMAAQNSLALAYARLGNDDQAVAHFRKALEIKPDALGVMMNLGSALHHQGKLDEAIENYRLAAKRFPAEVEPLRRLARSLAEKGEVAGAEEAYRQAVHLAPNRPDLLLALGNIYMAQTNYDAALDCYQQALKIEPTNAGLHYNLGIVEGLRGQTNAERQELMETLRLKPEFSPAQKRLLLLNAPTN
jgi:tetratricopeptide (TPR) repeat protein